MRSFRGAGCPRLKRLLGFPLRHDEVAVLALDRTQELETKEPGRTFDGTRSRGEPLLQLGAGTGGNFDCVDLHDCHAGKVTCAATIAVMLHDEGGDGDPILLLHGLMGSARTWRRQIPWLRRYGHVYTYDAPGHGRPPPAALTTEAFVEDLSVHAEEIGRATVVGHSMGSLHGWCLAAARPELVAALVVEDIAPDFRGRTADAWAAMIESWPQPFPTEVAVREYFGDVAGQYFLDSFERRPDGWYLHGDVATFEAISSEWGTRHFWAEWESVDVPSLLLEGEFGITPKGQMEEMSRRNPKSEYVSVPGAAHLIHDERPEDYREVVAAFLRRLR